MVVLYLVGEEASEEFKGGAEKFSTPKIIQSNMIARLYLSNYIKSFTLLLLHIDNNTSHAPRFIF